MLHAVQSKMTPRVGMLASVRPGTQDDQLITTPSRPCTFVSALHDLVPHHMSLSHSHLLHALLALQVPSVNNGSLAGILSHTSYTPPELTPAALSPLRCSACGTSADGVAPPVTAPVSPAQVVSCHAASDVCHAPIMAGRSRLRMLSVQLHVQQVRAAINALTPLLDDQGHGDGTADERQA